MPSPSHEDIIQLVNGLILPFHYINRQHKLPYGPRRTENDADHSWSLAVLACSLAPHIDPNLNVGLVAQFSIVHDLVEVYAGDTAFHDGPQVQATKADREADALERIKREFNQFPWLTCTLSAYEAKACDEAIFVYAMDKYIALLYDFLDNGEHLADMGLSKDRYYDLLKTHRRKAHAHPGVAKYYDQILEHIDSHPHFFDWPVKGTTISS